MALDIQNLQKELDALKKERFEVKERLRSMDPRGRGMGRGLPPPMEDSGPGFRSGGRGGPGFGGFAQGRDVRGEGPGGRGGRSYSPPRFGDGARGGFNGRFGGRGFGRGGPGMDGPRRSVMARLGPTDWQPTEPAVPEVTKKRVLSAVVVDEEALAKTALSQKRPAPEETDDNPAMKKRNRRMFGALLGTLQKFRDEDQAFQSSTLAQRRQEAQKKVEERVTAESERLKQLAREERDTKRRAELEKIRELNLATAIKRAEIETALRTARKQRLSAYLLTTSSKCNLYWIPAKHNAVTAAALEEQKAKFAAWEAEQVALLEKEKAKLQEQAAAAAAAADARRNTGRTNAAVSNAEEADNHVDEEEAQLVAAESDGEHEAAATAAAAPAKPAAPAQDAADAEHEDGEYRGDDDEDMADGDLRQDDQLAVEGLATAEPVDPATVEDLLS